LFLRSIINKTDKSTFFPLVERPAQLEARMKDQASKDIIRKSEPGGGLLYELHSLGGGDKHRLTCSFVRQAISAPAFMKAGPGWIGQASVRTNGTPSITTYDTQ
jgi:hypothetical protein